MNSLDQIIEIARKAALEDINKYGSPPLTLFEISNQAGQKIAALLKANSQLVMLGTLLMDFKLGEAFSQNKLSAHVQMSRYAAEALLKSNKLSSDQLDIVLNCIDGHHKTVVWKYLESEVCANADCYRFLTPDGIISFITDLGKRGMSLQEIKNYCLLKVEEKWGILSLPMCKKELEPNYLLLKKLLS